MDPTNHIHGGAGLALRSALTCIFTYWDIFPLKGQDALCRVAGQDGALLLSHLKEEETEAEKGAHGQGRTAAQKQDCGFSSPKGLAQGSFPAVTLSCPMVQREGRKKGEEEETGVYPLCPELLEALSASWRAPWKGLSPPPAMAVLTLLSS